MNKTTLSFIFRYKRKKWSDSRDYIITTVISIFNYLNLFQLDSDFLSIPLKGIGKH